MKKRIFSLALVILMVVSMLAFTSCNKAKPEEGTVTRMTVDINPSVEFMVDDQNKVVSVTALNDDGSILIAGEAFADCWNLTEVSIPDSVIAIGEYAFNDCTALTKAQLPENLQILGEGAFCGCEAISQVRIPQGLTEIRDSVFSGCKSITAINLHSNITAIGEYAFGNCQGLTEVYIPDSVTTIGRSAFVICSNLQRVRLSERLEKIAQSAFGSCSALTEINIPASVKGIGEMAFWQCSSLTSVDIPDSVTRLDYYAFGFCEQLTEIFIGKGMVYISFDAFSSSRNLERVYFCGDAPLIQDVVFEELSVKAYYHTGNSSWNENTKRNYGGDLTWIATHIYRDYLPDEGFNCTTGGTKTAQCVGCDATDTIRVANPAEHQYDRGYCTLCGAEDPNVAFLSGSIAGAGNTVLTLISNGCETASLTVTGDQYMWKGIQAGDYTLIARSEGHVTYRVNITVAPGENERNLTLCRPGDVVGIGALNMGDFAAIYAHVKGTALLTDYARDCADYNGDGRINMGDVGSLYAKIKSFGIM